MSGQADVWSVIAALAVIGIFWIKHQPTPGNYEPLYRTSMREMVAQIDTDASTDVVVTKQSDYPQNWWTSNELLELERRAIFAKMPIALAHASLFFKPGSYRVFDHPSGYPIFLVLGKDSVLRGFHNVCRHRAYPVVSMKQSGCTPVLSCRYHGWGYDLRGKLVKAPKFDGLDGFDKSEISLFEISVRVDANGVVFVNVGALPKPPVPTDVSRFSNYRMESWEVEVHFNWKFAEFADAFDLSHIIGKHTPKTLLGALFDYLNFQRGPDHLKPNVLIDIMHDQELNSLLMIKVRPVAAEKCVLECAFYSSPAISDSSSIRSDIEEEIVHCVSSLQTAYAKSKLMNPP
ncbi:uncharacterized protein A1O9_07717 [Exophiala aquamarina CBS 119918]|uniref:Rieske domain-containing protein n=1 Tax=Exophiala aquamarina CBS 119918 TaxID=1182545 RepID=A0A072P8C9_9EURO|nr:uncharacterized protein A1O9_07717 [Exophiala aquamarina CBS 119918]KEF56136.1 hypothetical protein A1O9_07717 [Exophiala aquamarina CBS 119918]